MNEYVCFYNGKRWECYASSMFDAKEKAVAYFKPPKSKQHMVRAVLAKWAAPQPEHDLKDVPCECCGYMTYHREHMGCIRAAAPKAAPGVGNSGFDHQSAADFLSGKTVTADTVRAQLATDGQGQAVANPAIDFPHEEFDAIAATRYKVVAADQSMFWGWAVVAGDGTQQLYVGRKVECENMARKFAGAFLDGAFYQANITPPTQAAGNVQEDAARYRWLFGARTPSQVTSVQETVFKPLPQDEVLGHLQGFYMSKADVDAAVDAAIAAQGGK